MAGVALDKVLDQVDELVVSSVNKNALSGLAVAIVQGTQLAYERGLGLADAEAGTEVTPDTVFRVGSISKTFTAIGLMQLWEQGKFKLDDPVNDYLKSFTVSHPDPGAPPVTFRHLLTHTSGIGEVRGVSDLLLFRTMLGLGVRLGDPIPSPADLYKGGLLTEIYPETKWAYANHGFTVLGQLVEDISGEPFPDYMISHVFEPLGMHNTDYIRSDRVREHLAVGYQLARGRMKPVDDLEITVSGAGSVFSSLHDMSQYVMALLNGGKNDHGSVLKPDTLKMMMEPHFQLDPHLPAMGLAFWLEDFDGHRTAQHGGGWIGFVSAMFVAPDDGVGVLAFTNTTSLAPEFLARELMRRLLDIPDPSSQLPRPEVLESPHLWGEITGSYGPAPGLKTNARVWMGLGGEVQILVMDNHLAMRTLIGPLRKGMRLYPIDASNPLVFEGVFDLVYEKQVVRVVFARNDAGEVDRLHTSFNTLYKRPRLASLRFRIGTALGVAGSVAGVALARRVLRK